MNHPPALPPGDTALTADRRSRELAATLDGPEVDVLVVGLGVTGAGVALDAASRGLSVVAIDAHDLAFGTSRWSSKLIHGGLRYLAKGQVGIAYESAYERGILMTRTAPHLVHALPGLLPLTPAVAPLQGALASAGVRGGDLLRLAARTPRSVLPKPRRLSVTETLAAAPVVRRESLRGGVLGWDGQVEDDARLVTALARTAAGYGARILTRVRAEEIDGSGARARDTVAGSVGTIRARAVVNATGVWADTLVPGISLQPSRGTHVVLRRSRLQNLRTQLIAPVPGEFNRYVFAIPQPDDTVYVGLTDEAQDGPVPEVPEPTDAEIDFLLTVIGGVLEDPLDRSDVIGAFAGLRPLLRGEGRSADLSRKHAVLTSPDGVVTIVGGKLTTYRRMAEDAVDAVVAAGRVSAGPCRTRNLPLVGAVGARPDAPKRLIRKYGAEAGQVIASAMELTGGTAEEVAVAVSDTVPVTVAELIWARTHEGALDADDVLDRRTRIGLVPADRSAVLPVVNGLFAT